MRTALVAALAGAIIAPSAAIAATPAKAPPRTVSGVKISWPQVTEVAPGTKLSVKVRSAKRRSQLAFLSVTPGAKRAVLAKKTLRSGTFSVTVPSAAGASYELRITVAGKRYASTITTRAPAPTPPPVSSPAPPPPLPFCTGPRLPFAAEVRADTTTVRAGESVAYTLVNTGQRPFANMQVGHLYADGVPGDYRVQYPEAPFVLHAGEQQTHQLTVPANTVPGRYRIAHSVQHADCDVVTTARFPGPEIEVVAPDPADG